MNPFENLSHAQIFQLDNESINEMLIDSWNLEEIKQLEVFGEVKKAGGGGNKFAVLRNIRHPKTGELLEYPIASIPSIQERSPFIPHSTSKYLLDSKIHFVKCTLELSHPSERRKHENPLLLNIKEGFVEEYINLQNLKHFTAWANNEMAYISKTVYEQFIRNQQPQIKAEVEATKKKLEAEFSSLVQQVNERHLEHKNLVDALTEQEKLNSQSSKFKAELSDKIARLEQTQQEIIKSIEIHKLTEVKMATKLKRLKKYIEEKAVLLKQLELIDDEDFDEQLGTKPESSTSENILSFEELDNDYHLAVSYIQAYLVERDILYPRHIIENFLALLKTNDLVILAGDSGSGKTNLVQSFANAIGGVAKIIPVKPNWTSSEDLLGYYNPLEKKYLATPFLEALLEAKNNPETPYLICLDEMNLARVEYYFADFLSKLEERNIQPEIQLYSDNESAHILSELKNVISIITSSREKYQKDNIVDFVKLMQDEEINQEMKRAFGFGDKDSLIKYHSDIRRMLSGVLGIPSSINFPENVRIIGAINIDETTHYLSPKILDRAHIMKFKSPLLRDWEQIFNQVSSYEFDDLSTPLQLSIDQLGDRQPYPKFDLDDEFCGMFVEFNRQFFNPLGIEFGMRTIRQGLNYVAIMTELGVDQNTAINNFILHKLLPKMHFDGNQQVGEISKADLLATLKVNLGKQVDTSKISDDFSAITELNHIIEFAKNNDGIVNYWS